MTLNGRASALIRERRLEIKLFTSPPPPVLRGALASILLVLLAGYANADGSGTADGFHCSAGVHVLAEPACPAGQARFLDRINVGSGSGQLVPSATAQFTLTNGIVLSVTVGSFPSEFTCGACVDESSLQNHYSSIYAAYWEMWNNNPMEVLSNLSEFFRANGRTLGAGRIIFNEKTYFNADSDSRTCPSGDFCGFSLGSEFRLYPPRRNNAEFCEDWFGGTYSEESNTCECLPGAVVDNAEGGKHARCGCSESGHSVLNNGTPSDSSDDFCAAPISCLADEFQTMAGECACPAGETKFNNGTESDPSDDFCERAVEATDCPAESALNSGTNECVCDNASHRIFTGDMPSDPSDDFCAPPVPCMSAHHGISDLNVCEHAPSSLEDGFHCPAGDLTENIHPFDISCPVGEGPLLARSGLSELSESRKCGQCYTSENALSGFRNIVHQDQHGRLDNNVVGSFRFNGNIYHNFDIDPRNDRFRRNNQQFCEDWLNGVWSTPGEFGEDSECRCGPGGPPDDHGICAECPEGQQAFDNGTPADFSDDFCAVSVCRADQVQKTGGLCECPAGQSEFDNGTPSDASDDFCQTTGYCGEGAAPRAGGVCECLAEGNMRFDNDTPSDISDDFCAIPASCPRGHDRTGSNGCSQAGHDSLTPREGYHCVGNHVANLHPFDNTLQCQSDNVILLSRTQDYLGETGRQCGECFRLGPNLQIGRNLNYQFSQLAQFGIGEFRFNGRTYFNFDVNEGLHARLLPIRNNGAFCRDWLQGEWDSSAGECYCASERAADGVHGICEMCPADQIYVNPSSPGQNRTGSCRPRVRSECSEYEIFQDNRCRPRTLENANCGTNTEFNEAPAGTEGGTCDRCGAGEESDGGDDRCDCLSGYERLNADACTNAHHRACINHDPAAPIATSIFTTDSTATPEPGNCRAAEDTEEDLAICNGTSRLFSRIVNGACNRGTDCTGSQYNILLELSNTDTDAGTCISEGGCARIVDGFPEMSADGNVCRLARNDEECSRILELQSQGSLFGRITDVGAQYDRREEHDCRPRVAGDCQNNHEFTISSDPRVGGTCEACERWEASTNGDECVPRTAANCASNYKFTADEVNGGGICELRAAMDCADDHEFMADASGMGGTCEMCDANEVSMDGAACSCPNATHFEEADGSCVDRKNPSMCENNEFVNSRDNNCTPCPVNNEVRIAGNVCGCPAPYFMEEFGTGQCIPRAAANCPADYEFMPAPGGAAGGTCEECHTSETSRNGAPCECVTGHTGDPATDSCSLPSNSQECADVREEFPIYASDVGSCVAATSAAQCRENFPSRPIFFVGGICRAATDDIQCQSQHHDFPIRNGPRCEAISCAPPGLVVEGECRPRPECNAPETPNAVNECECQDPNVVVSGVCEVLAACDGEEDRNVRTNRCECNFPNVEINGVCEAPASCAGNLIANDQNDCHCPSTHYSGGGSCEEFVTCADPLNLNEGINTCFCPQDTHFGDADSCVPHAVCTGENIALNSDDNTCVCADGFEGTPETACTACEGEYVSRNGAACACPTDRFDAGEGVCDEVPNCPESSSYNSATNACDCPSGQRLNADETSCEAIPAASSGGGGGSGAAIALIAVPAILIGGYYLLGGFEFIDPAYDFSYRGENEDFRYSTSGGFDLNHGSLSSYARAIQSDGDAVSYESGISYKEDFYSLNYAAYESKSEYDYDLSASLNYGEGTWSISPTADAEFNYSANTEDWNAETSAGVSAAWTSHKWNVRAHSAFAGDVNHGLDLEFRF